VSNLIILDNKSPVTYFQKIANAFFENWPLECKDYYGCNSVEEIKNKMVEEYKNNECPFTILYIKDLNIIGSISICKTDIIGLNYGPWITDLWVDKNYRNCGISKTLLNNILYYANKKFGINKIYLWVDVNKEFVVKLYENYGFTIVEKTIYCEKDIYIMVKIWDNINVYNEGLIYNQLLVNELNNS